MIASLPRRAVTLAWVAAGTLCAAGADGQPPAPVAEMPAVALPAPSAFPVQANPAPRNSGPAARAHSRYRRGRQGTTRVIRRTPEVMREDAARVRRGDLFSTWSNQYLE